MVCYLLNLPDDLLLAILVYLRPQDILSVQQTCRGLMTFCITDYLWHSIKIDFPLNLPHKSKIGDLSGDELRKLSVTGLHVDRAWRKNPSDLRALNRIKHEGIVSQMQYLPPKWLVTMSRIQTLVGANCVVSIWDCHSPSSAKRLKHFSFDTGHGIPEFSAALSEDSLHVFVVVFGAISKTDILKVYHVPLQSSSFSADHTTYLLSKITIDMVPGVVSKACICGETVYYLNARFATAATMLDKPTEFYVCLLDVRSGKHLEVKIDDPCSHMRLRLFPDSFLLIAGLQSDRTLALRAYNVGKLLKTLRLLPIDSTSVVPMNLGEPYAKYFSSPSPIKTHEDFELSSTGHITAMTFLVGTSNYVARFPIHIDHGVTRFEPGESQLKLFPKLSANANSELLSLGHSGQRAVWMEHKWDADNFTLKLVKGAFLPGSGPAAVSPLLAGHIALPFEVRTCQCIALDEAMGRVYLGLYTGEIYVLDL
ncbi:hypothetical protein BDP27DRAFT_1434895 [Rhodocollybia butyracea]|uniref:F-box domain-containing protein n=1 Tax=Rhodocollybia butyracea TaxID=206335 RepID=A0A9P5TW61_9AGAR|nr:hypothetical protein BDP27DRAFT_1434895 [Rhodocollybia butyracea]